MLKDDFRQNLRRLRAEALVNIILRAARECKQETADNPYHFERELYERLIGELNKHGAEIISDYDREQYGLPPRGPDGWTMEEIVALEQKRFEALMRPPPIQIMPADWLKNRPLPI